MNQTDRIFRSLFVALAVGLGWGIRGDFGHNLGAMYPGAALGLGFAFATGQKSMFRWMPVLGLIGGLGIALGGSMSYGLLHGYAKADSLINYAYGFFTLILQGGAWGCFGCAFIGLALEKDRLKASELFALILTIFLCGTAVYAVIVHGVGFHINPDRSDLSIGFTGGVIGLFLWLAFHDKPMGLRGAVLGYVGFGLGMSLGRLLANASYALPFAINHWNIMEVMCGFIGGFIFTFGMLGKKFDDLPKNDSFPLLGVYGIFYCLFGIPFLHYIRRVNPAEKLEEWGKTITGYGYTNPDTIIHITMICVYAVCVLAFLSALVWLHFYIKNKTDHVAFPILSLSLFMLLIQYLHAFYFLYPFHIMHNVNLVFLIVMGIYAFFSKNEEYIIPEDEYDYFLWGKWIAGLIVAYIVIILLAGVINGEETMKSACTRFPVWSWREGTN
ncbi:MAG: hypothetical protein C4527_27530 [Candidatus Omnitrophota bacterium]|jgi:hypothetical protein|nr:MAG: hypothetical protein C4527_27530 [Candidatus Omnitrophota bacterium]